MYIIIILYRSYVCFFVFMLRVQANNARAEYGTLLSHNSFVKVEISIFRAIKSTVIATVRLEIFR